MPTDSRERYVAAPLKLELLNVDSAVAWRAWLRKHHFTKQGVWLIFHKEGPLRQSLTYQDALDEALAYGWIDSIIKKLDSRTYARKFTPRRPFSIWSKLNIDRVRQLQRQGRMTVWGLNAFTKRRGAKSELERFNAKPARIPEDLARALKKNKRAWSNFQRFTPGYRKRYLIWISAAKRVETRRKRVAEAAILISQNVKNLLK
jgi:uncharacterized protein YdeI (YjbR/CyaY-like superfamily)